MRGTLLVIILGLAFVVQAKTQKITKLTGQGLLEISIVHPGKVDDADPQKSFAAIQVQRRMKPLEKSVAKGLLKKHELKIVVLGDSGCRLKAGKDGGGDFQNCEDPKAWPFHQVMKQVEKEKPDLILHLGDYHYRETCPKGAPCEKMSKVIGYGWEPWLKDFFEPVAHVSPKVPWMMTRGNHEDCKRAYMGWARLLATEDYLGECKTYEEPDIVVLKDLVLINLDTSHVPEPLDPSPENEKLWADRFKAIEAKVDASGVENVWLMTHKPFYGLVKLNTGVAPVNANLKKYLDASGLKTKIKAIFAGHIHLSQVIKPQSGPLQFILGNGGTQLDDFAEIVAKANLPEIGMQSVQTGSPGFGYAVFSREKKSRDWRVQFKDESGKITSHCQYELEAGICRAL
jgi:hypothetical protein